MICSKESLLQVVAACNAIAYRAANAAAAEGLPRKIKRRLVRIEKLAVTLNDSTERDIMKAEGGAK